MGACQIDRRPTDHSLGRWTCGQQFDTEVSAPFLQSGFTKTVETNFIEALQRHHQEGTIYLRLFIASRYACLLWQSFRHRDLVSQHIQLFDLASSGWDEWSYAGWALGWFPKLQKALKNATIENNCTWFFPTRSFQTFRKVVTTLVFLPSYVSFKFFFMPTLSQALKTPQERAPPALTTLPSLIHHKLSPHPSETGKI